MVTDYKRELMYNNIKNIIRDKCIICGTIEDLYRHRIIPRGPFTDSNVIILCRNHLTRMRQLMRNRKYLSHDERIQMITTEYGISSVRVV